VWLVEPKVKVKKRKLVMGIWADSKGHGENGGKSSLSFLTRRKRVDSAVESKSHGQLAKELTVPHLMAIGSSTFSSLLFLSAVLFYFQSLFSSGYGYDKVLNRRSFIL